MKKISVQIKVSGVATLIGRPDNNFFGQIILTQLMLAEMTAAGLNPSGFGEGVLNSSCYTFTVSDVEAARAVLLRVLTNVQMDQYAEIFRFDEDEIILRRIYPAGGVPVCVSALPPDFEAAKRQSAWFVYLAKNINATLKAALENLPPRSDSSNPPPAS